MEASRQKGLDSSNAENVLQVLGKPPEGVSLEAHLQQVLSNPSRIGKEIKKSVQMVKKDKEKRHREYYTIPKKELEQLSRIFGGLDFAQSPLSLSVYAKIDSANENTAKAITGIFNAAIREELFHPSDRQQKQPKPAVDNLFFAYQSDSLIPSKNAAGADLFLELKPQWAQSIIRVFSEKRKELRDAPVSSLHDCFEELFHYGRNQTELMGGTPLGLRFEERLKKQNSGCSMFR